MSILKITIDNSLEQKVPAPIVGNRSRVSDKLYDIGFNTQSLEIHDFINTIHKAFSNHWDLEIRPDDIFLIIIENLSIYIRNLDPKNLDLIRPIEINSITPFYDQSVDNLSGCIYEICNKLEKRLEDPFKNLLNSSFSTTKLIDKLISYTVVMDLYKTNIPINVRTLCGIPNILLRGTYKDWENLRQFVMDLNLDIYNLKKWSDSLIQIIDKFIDAFIYYNDVNKTELDISFWSNMYKYKSMSGSDEISGWCIRLFPEHFQKDFIRSNEIPIYNSKIKCLWKYKNESIPMYFISSFGIYELFTINERLTVRFSRMWGLKSVKTLKTLQTI